MDSTKTLYRLGVFYEVGKGFKQSFSEAVNLYVIAALKYHCEAMMKLVEAYECWSGVVRSYNEAANWYF
jgi:TPR repeat protein